MPQNSPCPSLPSVTRVCVVRKKGRFVVDPPIAFLAPKATLRIFNTTPEDLEFVFCDPKTPQRILIKAKGRGDIRLPDSLMQYSYQIWMVHSETWAKGNSDPVIIIDNP
jgi:hypothetical protein